MRKLTISFALLACCALVEAKVIKIVIEKRESPAYNGQVFGNAGQYELLSGHFTGELNPDDPHNKIINDIRLAVRNSRGMVEYTGTFAIAKPIDMSKASGLMIYSVPNRGNGAPVAGAEGHVSLVSGWQGDVQPRDNVQTIVVPIAKNADGSPVTGPVTALFINSPKGANTRTLASAVSAIVYQLPATLDTAKTSLTR